MPTRNYKPTSPGRRQMSVSTFEEVTRARPSPRWSRGEAPSGGRNSTAASRWHRGGGHKRLYRRIDFRRDKHTVPAKVASIEYDPNRSARIALLHYRDGEKRLHPGAPGAAVGDAVQSGPEAEIARQRAPRSPRSSRHRDPRDRADMPGRAPSSCAAAGSARS